MRRITLIFSVFLLLFSMTMFAAAPASAGIVRRCNATYEWQTTGGSIGPIPFGEFTAKGDCGNGVPNRCRKRARAAAKACIGTQWEKRWQHYRETPNFDPGPPAACLKAAKIEGYNLTTQCDKRMDNHDQDAICHEGAHESNVIPLFVGTKGDIKTALEAEVCCIYKEGTHDEFMNDEKVHVRLSGRTWSNNGNENCRSNIPLWDDYEIDCTQVRESICRS